MPGTARWRNETARDIARLSSQAEPGTRAAQYERRAIDALPSPVIRYFEFALADGQPLVERARIEWKGQFSMRAGRWREFTASQYYGTRPPGFVWNADIRAMPLLHILVRDAYLDHAGSLRASVGGIVKVGDEHDTPEMACGELLRYLAEALWFPTALLPSEGVVWTSLDLESARATLTPWLAHVGDYVERDEMRVPTFGVVQWTLPTGPRPYWRASVVDAHYEFMR